MNMTDDFQNYDDVGSAQILYASLDEQEKRRASVKRNVGNRAKFAFSRCIDGRAWSEVEVEKHLGGAMISRRRKEFAKGRDWLTRGAIACALTHRSNLIGKIGDLGKVCCEDDVVIARSLLAFIGNGTLQEGLEKLEGITLLDYRSRGDILAERDPVMQFGKYSVHRVDPAGLGSAACYFVPSHVAKKIVSFQTPLSTPVDDWNEMIAGGAFKNLYVVYPRPARIGDFPTTICYEYSQKPKWKDLLSRIILLRRLKHKFMAIRGDFREAVTTWVEKVDD
jgi:GR25 family glycosyltransferase involved in LPS biosynthesis